MAEIWAAAVATVAVGAYSADQAKGAADDASNASTAANNATIAEQRRQFDISNANQKPWLDAGVNALGLQQNYLAGDRSGFNKSADYLAAMDGGVQAVNRGAIGNLSGGGTAADLMQFGQQTAQRFGENWYAKLAGISGTGIQTAQGLGSQGMQMAGNIGNALQGNAAAQGRSAYATADANSQLAAGVGGAFNNWYQGNQANNAGGTGWYLGNNPGRG